MILVIACCVRAIRFLFKICDWDDYIETKANREYIQCSPKILEMMLNTLQYEIHPRTATYTDSLGFDKEVHYGIEWIQQDSYGRENSILIYGRTRREQEKMNSIVMKALQKKQTAEANKRMLANDATIDLLKQVQTDIQRTIDENLRTAQEAAKKNQEIMERLSGTSTTCGGSS